MKTSHINNAIITQHTLAPNPASEQSSTTAKATKIATVIFQAISVRAASFFSCLERFAIATGIVAVCDRFDRMLHYLLDCDFEKYVQRPVLEEAFRIFDLANLDRHMYTEDARATFLKLNQNKYAILGVKETATQEEIREAFLKIEKNLKPLFLEADKANCPFELRQFAEMVATDLQYAYMLAAKHPTS